MRDTSRNVLHVVICRGCDHSPNAEEALALLSLPLPPVKSSIEQAAVKFLDLGIGAEGSGCVIIRSGEMGAFVKTRKTEGIWVDAFWTGNDTGRVVDVTGTWSSTWLYTVKSDVFVLRSRKQLSRRASGWPFSQFGKY